MLNGVYIKNYRTDDYGLLLYKDKEKAKEAMDALSYYWNTVEVGNMGENTYKNLSSGILSYPYTIAQINKEDINETMKVYCEVFKDNKTIGGIVEVNIINSDNCINIYSDEDLNKSSINAKKISYSFKN